ncbi:hypothetical protein QNE35_004326 [Vibrio vulnificus]|nr:hypothetical protein [Vibrio vulnificus]
MIEFLDRPIAFHRAFIGLGIGVTGALLLSQSLYWSKRTNNIEGWFYKSTEDWKDETGMTRTEIETARKKLRNIGVLEEKKVGIPCRLHYRINTANLFARLQQTSLRDSCKQGGGNPASRDAGTLHTITENTHRLPETTTKIPSAIERCFESFWKVFPTRKAKKQAFEKFKSIVKRRSETPEEFTAMLCADVQARLQNGQFGFDKLHATTYLNQERWNDDHENSRQLSNQSIGSSNRFDEFNQHLLDKYGHTATQIGRCGDPVDGRGLGSSKIYGSVRDEMASQGITIDLGAGDFDDVSE